MQVQRVVMALVVAGVSVLYGLGQRQVNRGERDGDHWPWVESDRPFVRWLAELSSYVVGALVVAIVLLR